MKPLTVEAKDKAVVKSLKFIVYLKQLLIVKKQKNRKSAQVDRKSRKDKEIDVQEKALKIWVSPVSYIVARSKCETLIDTSK